MRIMLHPCYSDKLILLAKEANTTPSQYVKDFIMNAKLDTTTYTPPKIAQVAQGINIDDKETHNKQTL